MNRDTTNINPADEEIYMLVCDKCGEVAHFFDRDPANRMLHKDCGGAIRTLSHEVKVTHEQFDSMTQEQKDPIYQYAREFADLCNRLNARLARREQHQQEEACVPRCPTCGSTNIKPISSLKRTASVLTWGLASGKIGKQFECLNCKYKW